MPDGTNVCGPRGGSLGLQGVESCKIVFRGALAVQTLLLQDVTFSQFLYCSPYFFTFLERTKMKTD